MKKNKRFWNWAADESSGERTLFLNGTIAEDSWFDDDVTPAVFKDELMRGEGDITVWINSPGGDCIAAAQIYNMLMDYRGDVKVKIDGIAASAASVIAMAGTSVFMSPVSMMMIHNPLTIAMGDESEMEKAIGMLSEVKESIINAYEIRTGLSRAKLSHLMDQETWMDANKAVELGFADDILKRVDPPEGSPSAMLFSRKEAAASLTNKITEKLKAGGVILKPAGPNETEEKKGRSAKELEGRLSLLEEIMSGGNDNDD